jgi:2-dehydro-3-deoxygalactonokinase
MNPYLSCDWGTSSFRLSLVDPENFNVIKSTGTNKGILITYNSWMETLNAAPATRLSFYLNTINEQIAAIEAKTSRSLNGIPLLISGMASSSIGMMPLPYHEIPFFIDGTGMLSEFIPRTPEFKHDILLISGVRSEDDVMRGEETQLIGTFPEVVNVPGDQLFIFPGTHSKHIMVNNQQAVSFKTYMTGEFFDLLSKKSILHAGLEEGDGLQAGHAKESFKKAVREGSRSNLLNSSFKVRTNSLFDKLTKIENYHYLSGLLIGAELGEIAHNDTIEIYLCCGAKLKVYYETALEVLELKKVHSFSAEAVEKAAMTGQYRIYEKYINR